MKFTKQFQRYESDFTQFIATLKKNNPELEAQQRAGRALLWDKPSREAETLDRTGSASLPENAALPKSTS